MINISAQDQEVCNGHLEEIRKLFGPSCVLTVVVRDTETDRGMIISADDLGQVRSIVDATIKANVEMYEDIIDDTDESESQIKIP